MSITTKNTALVAYHGDPKIKERYLARVRAHTAADRLIKGQYWENGKGCAVGCTIEGSDHSRYETELGIPRALARLEDALFERLPDERAMLFPDQFLSAIPVGADLSMVVSQFLVWLLVDPVNGVIRFADSDRVRGAVETVAGLCRRRLEGDEPQRMEWAAADADAAYAAYAAATDVAYVSRMADKLIDLLCNTR